VRTEGDRRHWDLDLSGHSDLTAPDLMSRIENALTQAQWNKVGSASKAAQSHGSDWRFTGTDGRPWKATLRIESVGASGHDYTAAVAVTRGN